MRSCSFAIALAPLIGLAQCDMTATITAYNAQCGGFTIDYSIQGGTPPYQVLAYYINGTLLDTETSSTSGTFTGIGSSWGVQLEVTDALGCAAADLGNPSPMLYTHESSIFNWSTDCTSGITTLRLNPPTFPICDPANLHYELMRVDNGTLALFAEGTFADDWMEIGGIGEWQFQQPLPPGEYEARVVPTTLLCMSGTEPYAQCWDIWPEPAGASSYFGVSAGDCGANKSVRVNLCGAFVEGGLMRDDLRSAGLLPLSEPYSGAGYTYVGGGAGASIDPAWLSVTGSRAIVDWVVLEVRTNTAPYPVLRSKPAILLRNGEVWDTDGDPYVNFGVLPPGFRRLAIRHRNHLGVITANPVTMTEHPGPATDFRFTSTSLGGTQATMLVGLTRCLWPGDVTSDGVVKYVGAGNDRDPILQAVGGSTPTNVVNNVYSRADTNMDGVIKYVGADNDRDVILQTIGGSTPTATRSDLIP